MKGDVVEQIVDLVARSSVNAVTVRAAGLRVTVRKGSVRTEEAGHMPHTSPAAIGSAGGAHGPAASGAQPRDERQADAWVIRAQRVGVFRHADPRLAPGMVVTAGQPVGTIVSMNLPSEVKSQCDGIVSGVLVEDGSPVEYDQPLFAIAAAGDFPSNGDAGNLPSLPDAESPA